jgi:hypothetical protein
MDISLYRYLAGAGAAGFLATFGPVWYLVAPTYSVNVQMVMAFAFDLAGSYSTFELIRCIYCKYVVVRREEKARKAAQGRPRRSGA